LTRHRARTSAAAVALVALAVSYAWPMQGGGGVPNAHYVLVKALGAGTARIDEALTQLGDFSTNDFTVFEGHRYANKAPGFALVNVPAYAAAKAAGVRTTGDPARMLWALGLLSVVVPALVIALLVRERADLVAPGFGTAAAVAGGLGTVLLPYATLFVSHVLSAALVFAAFALLWRERAGRPRPALVAAAGLLAGYAVVTEYPNVFAVAILGGYVLLRPDRIRRVLVYGAAALAGALPLAAYNWWAFGSVTHVTYSGVGGAAASDLFGAPSLRVAFELLFSSNGLLVLTPVLACAAVGTVLLYRRGARAEALVVTAIAAAYLAFNSAYNSPFGGYAPGTRHLIPLIPFAAVALAPAIRAWPVTTGALAIVSATVMTLVTSTHVLAGYDGRWLDRLEARQLAPSAASLVGVTGWYATLVLFAAVAAALAAAVAATPAVSVRRWDTPLAGAAVVAWAIVAAGAPRPEGAPSYGAYATLAAVAACAALALLAARAFGLRSATLRPPAGEAR
jgi:hypothetical protein